LLRFENYRQDDLAVRFERDSSSRAVDIVHFERSPMYRHGLRMVNHERSRR